MTATRCPKCGAQRRADADWAYAYFPNWFGQLPFVCGTREQIQNEIRKMATEARRLAAGGVTPADIAGMVGWHRDSGRGDAA